MNQDPTFYKATAFGTASGGSGTKMIGGRLRIAPGQVLFESDQTVIRMSLEGLLIRAGGHDGAQVFFEHPTQPGLILTTADGTIANEPNLVIHPGIRQQLEAFQATEHRSRFPLAIGLVALAILIAASFWILSSKDKWVLAVAEQIPASVEEKIGGQALESIRSRQKFLTDPGLERQLKAVTDRLLQGIDRKDILFRFHIAADTNINAFAMPGGYVVVNSGLLKAVKRPEELAGVLAHEIAHVTRRHGTRNIIQQAGLMLLIQSVLGTTSGLEGILVQGSQQLLSQKYSRDFEREADETGWEYLVAADIDPRGLIDFFKILKTSEGPASSLDNTPLIFLSTHPATDDRIQSLEQRMESLGKTRKFRPISEP